MAGEKTEKASEHRKQEARKKGDIVRSRELTSALGTLAGVWVLGALAIPFTISWRGVLQQMLIYSTRSDLSRGDGSVMADLMRSCITPLWLPVGLVLAASLVATLGSGVAQSGGIQFNAEALAMKAERINPVTNLGNLFSLRSAARLAKSLIPAAMVLIAGVVAIEQDVISLPVLSLARIPALMHALYHLMLVASAIFLGWSALDYLVEWRSWEQRLRMSKDDMRDEYKQTEGNPQSRSRVRSIQRQMRKRKQEADIRTASVVIVNPTHYAVALSFDFDTMQAPKVLAKGRNLQAQKIKDTARWAGVPIIENPPLARSLYRSVEPGQSIPQDLYAAVAAILAFLYRQRMQEKMRAEEQQRARERSRQQHARARQQGSNGSQGSQESNVQQDPLLYRPLLTAASQDHSQDMDTGGDDTSSPTEGDTQ